MHLGASLYEHAISSDRLFSAWIFEEADYVRVEGSLCRIMDTNFREFIF